MIHVRVTLLGPLRDAAGRSSFELIFRPPTTGADLLSRLADELGPHLPAWAWDCETKVFAPQLKFFHISGAQKASSQKIEELRPDSLLADHDEIILVSPIAGG